MTAHELARFRVYGDPATKGNLRRSPTGGLYEANPRLDVWRRRVGQAAGEEMERREKAHGVGLYDGGVRLRLRFVLLRPKGHYTSKGELNKEGQRHPWPDKRPDMDKLERAILDALKGIVYRDDGQVVQKETEKVYGEPACVEVEVEPARPFDHTNRTRR